MELELKDCMHVWFLKIWSSYGIWKHKPWLYKNVDWFWRIEPWFWGISFILFVYPCNIMCLYVFGTQIMSWAPWTSKLNSKNSSGISRKFDVRSSGETAAQVWISCSRHFLQKVWCPLERPSARVSECTLERKFGIASTFAGLLGPLERGSPRSSGDPVFWNYGKALCVSFSVPFHF